MEETGKPRSGGNGLAGRLFGVVIVAIGAMCLVTVILLAAGVGGWLG